MPLTLEQLRKSTAAQVRSLYSRASQRDDAEAKRVVGLILENDLLADEKGGLPHDHPIMLEISELCADPKAIDEAVAASEAGLPALAGCEHRLVSALGENYGRSYTTNYAGMCVRDGMLERGWAGTVQKPMPEGSIAKTATVFVRKVK